MASSQSPSTGWSCDDDRRRSSAAPAPPSAARPGPRLDTPRLVDRDAAAGEGGQALALVLREAITNVVRHSDATSCDITVERDGGTVRLTVEDNGKGFDGTAEGGGLAGMRARVSAIGGELRLEGSNGARLVVELSERPEAPDGGRLEVAGTEGTP